MRLTKITVKGFRRLNGAECAVTGKLLCFVGPNEAGKSSLLDALLALDNNAPIPSRDRPRGQNPSDDSMAVIATFRIEDQDLAILEDLPTRDRPQWLEVIKRYDGEWRMRITPHINRDSDARRHAERAVIRFSQIRAFADLERTEDGDGRGDRADFVLQAVAGDDELDEDQLQVVATAQAEWANADPHSREGQAAVAVQAWLSVAKQPDPHKTASDRLWARRPTFIIFSPDDRALASDYDIQSSAEETQQALANLLALSGLDIEVLARDVAAQDIGAVETATELANSRLAEFFGAAWGQAAVTVRLRVDGPTLRVLVSNTVGGFTSIAERSDGLKQFVALTAFAQTTSDEPERPLILLIDEVETHLHYDAQADLIRMLDRQALVQQVLYTTHSAGCLPFDLGTGIRSVVPVEETGFSRIGNAFWSEGPGFSPVLMAMGATAAAFTPSRYAVIGEGASDMIMFPTMAREASGATTGLPYQVTGGLAEVASSAVLGLDLAASRVVYLVDGDAAGDALRKKLTNEGVPEDRVISLGGAGSGLTLEDSLRPDVYGTAVTEVLRRMTKDDGVSVPATALQGSGSASAKIAKWCSEHGYPTPSKTAVASMLIEQRSERLLSAAGAKAVAKAHLALVKALGIPAST